MKLTASDSAGHTEIDMHPDEPEDTANPDLRGGSQGESDRGDTVAGSVERPWDLVRGLGASLLLTLMLLQILVPVIFRLS